MHASKSASSNYLTRVSSPDTALAPLCLVSVPGDTIYASSRSRKVPPLVPSHFLCAVIKFPLLCLLNISWLNSLLPSLTVSSPTSITASLTWVTTVPAAVEWTTHGVLLASPLLISLSTLVWSILNIL